jgi:hypothetical protein
MLALRKVIIMIYSFLFVAACATDSNNSHQPSFNVVNVSRVDSSKANIIQIAKNHLYPIYGYDALKPISFTVSEKKRDSTIWVVEGFLRMDSLSKGGGPIVEISKNSGKVLSAKWGK